jgi:hypothetical protein
LGYEVTVRRRRDNTIDSLPDELRDLVRAMMGSKAPRFSYQQIIDRVEKESGGDCRLSKSALARYWNAVMAAELVESERRLTAALAFQKQVADLTASAGDPEALTAKIIGVLDAAILTNETDPKAVKPAELLQAKAALERVLNEKRKLDIRERELAADLEKAALEREKLERALQKERDEAERKRAATEKALADAAGADDPAARAAQALKAIGEIWGLSAP